jgi:hypothetical protein
MADEFATIYYPTGADLDGNTANGPKIKHGPIQASLQLSSGNSASGIGHPATPAAAKAMIEQYQQGLGPDATICITMGRNAILRILSEEGCEGIRFYFAQSHDKYRNPLSGTTGLVAIGIDETIGDLGMGDEKTILNWAENRVGGRDPNCSDCNPPHTQNILVQLANGEIPNEWRDEAVSPDLANQQAFAQKLLTALQSQ